MGTSDCVVGGGHSVYGETGFLAGVTAEESAVGTASCPWIVRGRLGRRVNLTLYSFSRCTGRGTTVVVLDRNLSTPVPVCSSDGGGMGGRSRERRVYTSAGSVVRLFVRSAGDDHMTTTTTEGFVIRYHGNRCSPLATTVAR